MARAKAWGVGVALGSAIALGIAGPALSQTGASEGDQPANIAPDRSGPPTTVRGPVERESGVNGQGAPGDDRVDGGGNGADLPGGRTD
jgi:hypothetical protein